MEITNTEIKYIDWFAKIYLTLLFISKFQYKLRKKINYVKL